MANRRIISKQIVDSDMFLDMPITTQALYFHLIVRADDDGFIGNPKKITRMIGCSEDDLRLLIAKGFAIVFESGVIVITHWGMHNSIRKDRYTPTIYTAEKSLLTVSENGAYIFGNQLATNCQPNGNQVATKEQPTGDTSKDKLSKDKLSKDKASCTEPLENDSMQDDEQPEVVTEMADVVPINLSDGSDYIPDAEYVEKLKQCYPSVDIQTEFRKMAAWCISNPTRRKTKRGINSFINSWLSKAQNSYRGKPSWTRQSVVPEYMKDEPQAAEPAAQEDIAELQELLKKHS